jgi:tetratricopeptide (TPR) repeat protein
MKKFFTFFVVAILALSFNLSLFSASFDNLFKKGVKEFKAENYEEAIEIFNKAYQMFPNSTSLCYFIGLTYRNMENYKKSIPFLEKAVTLSPKIKEAVPELIDSYYQLREYRKAITLLYFAEKNNFFPDRIYFLKGLVLLKLNKLDESLSAFQKAKKLNPSISQSIDFQIASIYIKKNMKKEALSKLQSVIMANPGSDLAAFSRDYINLLKKRIAVEKIWHFNVSMMFKYDSNVILKPSSSIQGIDISDKEDNGMTASASIGYTAPFSFKTPFILNVRYTFFADNYFSIQSHDVTSHSIIVTPGYSFKKASFSIPVSYSYTWVNKKSYLEQISVSPVLRFLILANHYGEIGAGYKKNNYRSETISKESDRDSNYYYGYLGYMYLFKKQKGVLNLKFNVARDDTQGAYWETTNYSFSANLLYPLSEFLKLQLGIIVEKDDYDNSQPSIGSPPGTNKKRTDKIFTPSVGINYVVNDNFNILLQYQHTRSDSNIPIFDYKRDIIMTGVEYRW